MSMEQIEMIERLREKAELTYDEAKGILESVNWNLLDAMIALEKEGKLKERQKMSYSTKQENLDCYGLENVNGKKESVGDILKRAVHWCGEVLLKGLNNKLCVERKGSKIIEIPVTIAVLLMIPAFYVIIIALLVAFFAGCKFSFSGPDLGTDKINDVLGRVEFEYHGKDEKSDNQNQDMDINDKK
ncbi:MAG: DUF4342 domain-containing protein [Ruminococcus sp.]|nr:DUF4342 domain-containing protein [Ruminococcus sp.]